MLGKRTRILILATLALILVLGLVINVPLDLRLLVLTPKILKYRGLIQQHAAKETLDARLVCALIVQESGFDEKGREPGRCARIDTIDAEHGKSTRCTRSV